MTTASDATTDPASHRPEPTTDPSSAPSSAPRRRRLRFVHWVALFALANAFLVMLPMQAFPPARTDWTVPRHTLQHALTFLRFGTGSDSWWPMAEAANYLADNGGREGAPDVYQAIFFEQRIKFQYPLTSLLPMELGGIPADPDAVTYLTIVSWVAMWVTALFVVLILFESLRRFAPGHLPRRWFDAAVLAGVVGAMTLTFYPLTKGAVVGQIQVWLNCLFAVMVWLWMTRREVFAGILGGLICVVKPQLGLLLLWGLLRKRWGFSIALSSTAAIASIVAIGLYGFRQNLAYLDVLNYLSRRGESYFNNQTVNGLLNRLFENGPATHSTLGAFAPWNAPIYAVTTLSSLALIALALVWRIREHASARELDLVVASLAFTMASPIAWEPHYGILAPVYALLLPALLRWPVYGRRSLVLLGASFVLASHYWDAALYAADNPLLTPLLSTLFFAALFVLVTSVKLRHAQAAEEVVTDSSAHTAATRTAPASVDEPARAAAW